MLKHSARCFHVAWQKSSRACLLLLDLGHIAFRRDGARQGSKVDLSATDREVASCEPGVDTDLGGGFEEDHEHGDGFKTPNIARNDWRLDIAGVQVWVTCVSLPTRFADQSAGVSNPSWPNSSS